MCSQIDIKCPYMIYKNRFNSSKNQKMCAIENIEKVFNSENVKKIKTFAFALGDKVDLNKNTRSQ